MNDPFKRLYDGIAQRKHESRKSDPYTGGNGRIDRAVDIILDGVDGNVDPLDPLGFPRGGTLVDVGGAIGNLGYALRDHYSQRIVVDITDECEVPAKAKGNLFLRLNVDTDGLAPINDGTVDLVVALDFIEHILDPQRFSAECLRVLRPGGRVLINTPNIQYWRHLQSLVVDGRFPHTSGDQEVYHGGHVAFFNRHDLDVIFAKFSDHFIHTRGLTADPPPPLWTSIAKYHNAAYDLSYADLIFSCTKD